MSSSDSDSESTSDSSSDTLSVSGSDTSDSEKAVDKDAIASVISENNPLDPLSEAPNIDFDISEGEENEKDDLNETNFSIGELPICADAYVQTGKSNEYRIK